MQVAPKMSFELEPQMLKLLHDEFDPVKLADKFARAIAGKKGKELQGIGEKLFSDYGRDWIRKTVQLGEEYPDRTYETLRAAIDKTGGYYKFGLVPQRFLEVAYLAIQQFATLPIIECYNKKLVYRIPDCYVYKNIKEKAGEEAAKLFLCQHACLAAARTLHDDLAIDALVEMDATTPKEGYCQFVVVPA